LRKNYVNDAALVRCLHEQIIFYDVGRMDRIAAAAHPRQDFSGPMFLATCSAMSKLVRILISELMMLSPRSVGAVPSYCSTTDLENGCREHNGRAIPPRIQKAAD